METPLIVRKGWLQEKGPHLKKFKKCWVKLSDALLQVFADEKEQMDNIIDSIPLNGGIKIGEVDKKEEKKMDYVFQVFYPLQPKAIPIRFCAETKQEYLDWMRDINRGIDVGSSNIFGVDLLIVVHKQSGRSQLPVLVEKTINYLANHTQVPGIFRVSGTATDVIALKTAYDRGDLVDLSVCPDPHVVSNLLKLFLRELPNPLLTSAYYPKFIEAFSIPNPQDQIDRVRTLINCLPAPHVATLQYLLSFLNRVASFSSVNMMTTLNLATVFGPTILRPGVDEVPDATKMEMANILTDKIIQSYDKLFPTASPQSPSLSIARPLSGTPAVGTSASSTPVTSSPNLTKSGGVSPVPTRRIPSLAPNAVTPLSSPNPTPQTGTEGNTGNTIAVRRVISLAPNAVTPLSSPNPTPQTGTALRKLPPSIKEAIETRDESSDENARKLGALMTKSNAPVLKPATALKRATTSPSLASDATPNGTNTPNTSSMPSSPATAFRASLKPVGNRPLPSTTPNNTPNTNVTPSNSSTTPSNVINTSSSTINPPPPINNNEMNDNGALVNAIPPPPLDSNSHTTPPTLDQNELPVADFSNVETPLPLSSLPPPPLSLSGEPTTPSNPTVIQQIVPPAKPDLPSSKGPGSRQSLTVPKMVATPPPTPISSINANSNSNANAKIGELEARIQSLESALESNNALLLRVLTALEKAQVQI